VCGCQRVSTCVRKSVYGSVHVFSDIHMGVHIQISEQILVGESRNSCMTRTIPMR